MNAPAAVDRPQTLGEEIANAVSHGIGLALALAALSILVRRAAQVGHAADIVAASLYGATAILLYATSTLYHALAPNRAKQWLQRLDHAAIFVFIAGSYMPYALGVLAGPWGWSLFGVVWGLAAIGVTAKLFDRLRHPWMSTGLYVFMGWVALVAVVPLFEHVPKAGLAWLFAGGACYTIGALVFMVDSRFRYAHFVWHLFVLAGSACHFVAALDHAIATRG